MSASKLSGIIDAKSHWANGLRIPSLLNRPLPEFFGACCIVLLAAAICLPVATDLLYAGSLIWHVKQPAVIQGGIEVIALFLAFWWLVATDRFNQRLRIAFVVLLAALYLRRHHVDLPLLASLFYLEGILAVGVCFSAFFARGSAPIERDWPKSMLWGFTVWGLFLWCLQVLGFGSAKVAAISTIILFPIALVVARREPLSIGLLRHMFNARGLAIPLLAFLLVSVLLLFARTNIVTGFDSLWYGLRPDQVLVGNSSVFDALGLVSPVYYFPKYFEVLHLPLSVFGDFSFVNGFNVWISALLAFAAYQLVKRFGQDQIVGLLCAVLVFSVPAVSGTGLSPKPDVFAAFAVICMAWFASNLCSSRDYSDLNWLLAWSGLAFISKINVLPFSGIVFLVAVAAIAICKWRGQALQKASTESWLALGLVALLAVFVTARTYWVTGMPTVGPEQLVGLWQFLGFSFSPPVGTLNWTFPQQWGEVPAVLFEWILAPSPLPHIITTWPGNAWLWLTVAALVLGKNRPVDKGENRRPFELQRISLWVLVLIGLLMLIVTRFHVRGGDGNYFIAPLVAGLVLATVFASTRLSTCSARKGLVLGGLLIAFFQTTYAFVSAGWSEPGTRTFDLNFTRSVIDTPQMLDREIRAANLTEIEAFLAAQPQPWRLLSQTSDIAGFYLSARVETFTIVGYSFPDPFEDQKNILQWIACAKLDAVILTNDPFSERFQNALRQDGLPAPAILAANEQYRLLDLRDRRATCPQRKRI